MFPIQLSPTQRKGIYTALFCANALLIALAQAGTLPAAYAQVVSMVSLLVAAGMKHFASVSGAPDTGAQ